MFQNASVLAFVPLLIGFKKNQASSVLNRKTARTIFIFAGVLQVGAQWSLYLT